MNSNHNQTSVEKILALIADRASIGKSELGNFHKVYVENIQHYVLKNQKIQLVLPAFPAKSPNYEKTSGHLPDMGEVLSLKSLNELCCQIQSIYSPGAEVLICSDGYVFSDLVRISDEQVEQFKQEIQVILNQFNLSHIQLYHLDDFLSGNSYQEMRELLVENYAESISAISHKVKTEQEMKFLFNGIHRFLFEDQLVLDKQQSKNKIRTLSKQLTYQVIQRSNAWSSLIAQQFPYALRLSIHPHCASSGKLGIQLMECADQWGTPWHNVVLHDGNKWQLVKRKHAEELNAKPVKYLDKYIYYALAA